MTTRTGTRPPSSEADRHTQEQLDWIAEAFPRGALTAVPAFPLACEVPVYVDARERAYTHRKPGGGPIEIHHTEESARYRPVVVHEFAHAYHLTRWPRVTEPVLCETLAFLAEWRACTGWPGDDFNARLGGMMSPQENPWVRWACLSSRMFYDASPTTVVEDVMEAIVEGEWRGS